MKARRLFLILFLLVLISGLPVWPALALQTPQAIWKIDYRSGLHDYDWARRYSFPLDEYEPVISPHSWSADGKFLVCEGWYTGGSPIDTMDALYVLNLDAQASYRLYTTGRRGADDPGLVWSWNSKHDRLYYQTRFGPDTGYWSWYLPQGLYRHHVGPRLPQGFGLRELDGLKGTSQFGHPDADLDLRWSWGRSGFKKVVPFETAEPDQRNRVSNPQQSLPLGQFKSGYDSTQSFKQPGSNQVWEHTFSDDYVVFQMPSAPYDLIVLYRQDKQLQLERHRYGQSKPLKRLTLVDSAPEEALTLAWAPRHQRLLLLTHQLALIDPEALSFMPVSDRIPGTSKTLLLNAQETALVVSAQHWKDHEGNGTVMHVFAW